MLNTRIPYSSDCMALLIRRFIGVLHTPALSMRRGSDSVRNPCLCETRKSKKWYCFQAIANVACLRPPIHGFAFLAQEVKFLSRGACVAPPILQNSHNYSVHVVLNPRPSQPPLHEP